MPEGSFQSSYISRESLTYSKLMQLDMCQTIPHFYISIEGWRIDPKIKKTKYTIEIGVDLESEILVFSTEKRYSEFYKLHSSLLHSSKGKYEQLSKFPPKKFFGTFEEDFIRKRQLQLQEYFSKFSSFSWIIRSNDFDKFFHYNEVKSTWHQQLIQQQIM